MTLDELIACLTGLKAEGVDGFTEVRALGYQFNGESIDDVFLPEDGSAVYLW